MFVVEVTLRIFLQGKTEMTIQMGEPVAPPHRAHGVAVDFYSCFV